MINEKLHFIIESENDLDRWPAVKKVETVAIDSFYSTLSES